MVGFESLPGKASMGITWECFGSSVHNGSTCDSSTCSAISQCLLLPPYSPSWLCRSTSPKPWQPVSCRARSPPPLSAPCLDPLPCDQQLPPPSSKPRSSDQPFSERRRPMSAPRRVPSSSHPTRAAGPLRVCPPWLGWAVGAARWGQRSWYLLSWLVGKCSRRHQPRLLLCLERAPTGERCPDRAQPAPPCIPTAPPACAGPVLGR